MNENILFPRIEPYQTGRLKVDETHELYWEVCGNPEGVPVVFLHGGPGAGSTVEHRRFFDPEFYRIVIFDQRGAGRSTPHAELKNNTPTHLVADMEKLRELLNIDKWLVFGGSWGSTLAILYGETHPDRCLGFILRGVWLIRPQELEWFIYGMRHFLPETWERFATYIPQEEQHDLVSAFHKRLTDPDPAIHIPAAKLFSRTEGEMSSLMPDPKLVDFYCEDQRSLGLARIEIEYMKHHTHEVGQKLLDNIQKIKHLPAIFVQGRYDMCCPPMTAYEVAKAWPKAILHMIPDAGHATSEPSIARALVNATQQFKQWIGK